jgi:hypothetical protein
MRRFALSLSAFSLLIIAIVGVLLVTQSGDDTGDLEAMSMDALVEDLESSEVVLVTAKGEHLEISYEVGEGPTHYVDIGQTVTNLPEYLENQGVDSAALNGPGLAYEDTNDGTEYLETYGLAIGGIATVLLVLGIVIFIRSDGGGPVAY